jgi:AraC-like DNA-binding protein
LQIASQHGIDAHTLLEGSGIEISDVDDPYRLITTLQELNISRRCSRMIPEPWIPLELGKHFHLGAKGKLGMAAMCCDNGMESLKLLITYIDMASSYFQYEVWTEGDVGYAHLRELVEIDDIGRFICEAEIASLHTILAHILDDSYVFKGLRLAYPAPAYAARYREFFKCPVKFGAPEHLIIFDAGLLAKPLKLANPLTRKVLEKECAQLCARLRADICITDRVRHEILFGQSPYPTLVQLAKRINLSESTIRRHLEKENTSFKDILSDLRYAQALDLLCSTDLSMEKIALKLGYSDVANFYHAFKEWTGGTPGNYRKSAMA